MLSVPAANPRTSLPLSRQAFRQRSALPFVAVACALLSLLLAAVNLGRPARAAATLQQPPMKPTPDYSNVDDILNGRRLLLRDDDFAIVSDTDDPNKSKQASYKILQTTGGAITSESPVSGVSTPPHDAQLTQVGRMWNLASDVVVTAFTHSNIDLKMFQALAYSPAAKTSTSISLWEHTSLSEGEDQTRAIILNSMKMADFNQDGFDDLVINYGHTGDGENAIQIVNAKDVNNFADGWVARGENVLTGKITNDAMVIGDFNGDGRPEIIGVIPQDDGTGLRLVLHTVDPKTLLISNAVTFPLTLPEEDAKAVVSYIAAAPGRFTNTTHDQLLIAFANRDNGTAKVKLVDFDTGNFQPLELSIWDTGTQIFTGRNGIHDYTGLLLLKVGRFTWSAQYDQALLIRGYNAHRVGGTSSFECTFSTLAINPGDFSIQEQGKVNLGDYGSIYDLVLGNFDRRDPNPQNPQQKDRNPNLQAAILSIDYTGYTSYVTTYNIDPKTAVPTQASSYNFQNAVAGRVSFASGDMQGRSMRLGEPIKVVINGTVQPSVVLAAPPMHIDYIGSDSKVVNVSAIPDNFSTSYQVEEKSSNQSTSTHTSSWSFSAKESIGASVEFGDVEEGEGAKFSDTFKAGQDLKGSTENTHGTYASHTFDISQETGFSDQLWFSQSRFNIYVYPVIGQNVCPKGMPNCAEDAKVPLTVQFSGPDQTSSETVAASQIEWYQPPWEYGNLLSYPATYAQLQQVVPDIEKLSTDLTWATDASNLTVMTNWASGMTDSQSSSFSQNYSFENDFSSQTAGSYLGVTVGFTLDIDVSGSFGFSSLNKSTTTLGKSTGIGVHKPGSFPDPPTYSYFVTPYIYGHMKKGGSVDNIPLTGDVQTFGLLQTAFAVDPLRSGAGGWWKQTYTTAPDVALNHPNRWSVGPQSLSNNFPSNCLPLGEGKPQMDCAALSPSHPDNPWLSDFHDMRGFFISKASQPGVGPQLETAIAGDKLALQARVYNFSLYRMAAGDKVHVRFYGMKWNNANNTPIGDSFLIGEAALPPIPPFSTDDGAPLNYLLAETDFDTTPYADQYLVFWVVSWSQGADGKLTSELPGHGLTAIPDALKNLVDASKFEESFSNNVGFYRLPFYVFNPSKGTPLLSASNGPDDVRLDLVKVSGDSIEIGQSVAVSALLHGGARSSSGITAVFYDGDPQRFGKAFDAERIPYLRAGDTHEVKVSFRPQVCGFHQVFVSIGKGTPFEATSGPAQVQVKCEVQVARPACSVVCQRSPQFYLNNINRLPAGIVTIAGSGIQSSITTRNAALMRLVLGGGISAQARFNQQFVATQLSLLSRPGTDSAALQSLLSCYGLDFAPVRLSNGSTLGPSSSFGELLSQARNSAHVGDTGDLLALAAILGQLNGNDPSGRCSTGAP